MSDRIEPRLLKGFRDSLPEVEAGKEEIVQRLVGVFRLFGFVPIDTPAIEYAEILLGKGGGETDKQIYRFRDHGRRDVALRFDLTVPFARFMAAHHAEILLPFKRYHIGKVWRGENTQRGRYREFTQCDFDIVGVDSASADLEILLLIEQCMRALGIDEFTIHYSHRGLLNRFVAELGQQEKTVEVLRTVDKLGKIGRDAVTELLEETVGKEPARRILAFIDATGSFAERLRKTRGELKGAGEEVARLEQIGGAVDLLGGSATFMFDPSITRGLDYYTGVVFETYLAKMPDIGSVCSGGRYNDLASLYTKKRIPGVGSSVGIDRLLAALEELGVAPPPGASSQLLVLYLDDRLLGHYHQLCRRFQQAGISTEVYPEKRKLAVQFAYAEKKRIPLGLICGEDEYQKAEVAIKDLASRASYPGLTVEAALGKVRALLQ